MLMTPCHNPSRIIYELNSREVTGGRADIDGTTLLHLFNRSISRFSTDPGLFSHVSDCDQTPTCPFTQT